MTLTRHLGRPRQTVTIADRKLRSEAATFAGSHVLGILKYLSEVYQDETKPDLIRMAACDRLLDRALGKPTLQTQVDKNTNVQHRVLVSWLPPDPSDRSNYIAPIED